MSAESVIIYRNMHCTSNFMQEEHFSEKGDYYLILDNNLNKALLGDDFISCCTFHHQPKGDIVITAIDMDLYALSYETFADCIDISEVLQYA